MAKRADDSNLDGLVTALAVAAIATVLLVGFSQADNLGARIAPQGITDQELQARQTVIDTTLRIALSIIGAGVAWLTYRRIRAVERTAAATESGQETDRYSRAIEQLGHDQVNIRIGGLYALQALARDNPERFAATIYDVIIAFIREQTRPDEKIRLAREEWETQYDEEHANPDSHPIKPGWPRTGTDVETALSILTASRPVFDQHHPKLTERSDAAEGPNLTNADLRNRHLIGLDLSHANLTRTRFNGAKITDANFDKATIKDTRFNGATITDTSFDKATIADTGLYGATITDSGFNGATIVRANFNDATFVRANFNDATITDTNFSEATIAGTSFFEATITDTSFHRVTITDTAFHRVTITDTAFHRVTITGASFFDAKITDSGFFDSTIKNTRFNGAKITASGFLGATIVRANFSGATITGTSFDRVNAMDEYSRASLPPAPTGGSG